MQPAYKKPSASMRKQEELEGETFTDPNMEDDLSDKEEHEVWNGKTKARCLV